jgi:hypothetical protein
MIISKKLSPETKNLKIFSKRGYEKQLMSYGNLSVFNNFICILVNIKNSYQKIIASIPGHDLLTYLKQLIRFLLINRQNIGILKFIQRLVKMTLK